MLKIVCPGWKTGDNSFGITVPYYDFLSQYGEVVILSPGQYVEADLLLLPGGLDVDPTSYGKIPSLRTSNPNILLEYFDKNILPKYIESGTPVYGVCRGLQAINTFFHGTLIQHLKYHNYSDPRSELVHGINIKNDIYEDLAKQYRVKPNGKIKTNSMHHQCIKTIGEGLRVIAVAEDGVPEAILHNTLPIAACQNHPEEMEDALADYLIHKILKQAGKI
jgi:putative glutamine amidotransferase